MATTANLGFPRLGLKREWKRASERYWSGRISQEELLATASKLTARHWALQADQGVESIPCGDFSFYDLMLDTAVMVGAIPERYGVGEDDEIDVDTYFALARGRQDETADVTAMEMTKWFDTNYHYIVPEFEKGMRFRLASGHPFDSVERARAQGIQTPRPVLIGPATFLLLGKVVDEGPERVELAESLGRVYGEVLRRFHEMNIPVVQVDEPALVLDLDEEALEVFRRAYSVLPPLRDRPKMLTTTYFGSITHNLDLALSLGEGIHLDLVRAPEQLPAVLGKDDGKRLVSLGVVNGRNIWRTDLDRALKLLRTAEMQLGGHDRIEVAPSCSLLHSPIDLDAEDALDPEVKEWLAFGKQKLAELTTLKRALTEGEAAVQEEMASARDALRRRREHPRVHNDGVRNRQATITEKDTMRPAPFPERKAAQQKKLKLPLLPTTTIGSFPQTREVRRLRLRLRKGEITQTEYDQAIEAEILKTIRFQEEAGLDVLVHGEFERNDMVEYFGQQLEGYVFTKNGWVQSYGSRGVKPPILFGDVHRPSPMSVRWSRFARENTDRPMKGMLTGPVTMLKWSFVRDDQPLASTCEQIALAIRDEVQDLEQAGIDVIQIDEPALREALPLRKEDWPNYLDWAVRCFRLSSSGVHNETQIHTHMCYSEFNEIFDAIAALDADVISIEASRSRMELLDAFEEFHYPNDIGPGVYDIHSPRVPTVEEMVELLRSALVHVGKDHLWVNPDCGLKTRAWQETEASLLNMVASARKVRTSLQD